MIYLIYGNQKYLLDQELNKIIKGNKNTNDIIDDIHYFDYLKSDLLKVLEDAITIPFFSKKKVIVLDNCYFLTGQQHKTVFNNDLTELEKYIDNPVVSTDLILFLNYEKLDERKKIVKLIKQKAKVIVKNTLNELEVKRWVNKVVKDNGGTIDNRTIDLFISLNGNDMLKLNQEINKLVTYNKNVTVENVKLLCNREKEDSSLAIVSAFMSKDKAKSLQVYQDLLFNNVHPLQMMAAIASELRLLYQIKLLLEKGINDNNDIGRVLGVKPGRIYYVRKRVNNHSKDYLLSKLNQLSTLDFEIKSGKITEKLGFELFLLKG